MRLIKLTQGMFTIVSDCDYEEISKNKWYAKKSAHNWYACRCLWAKGDSITIRMHREITNCPPHQETHHKDGCTLNNLRENLENMPKKKNLYIRNHP